MITLQGEARQNAIDKLTGLGFDSSVLNSKNISSNSYAYALLLTKADDVERGLSNGLSVTDFLDLLDAEKGPEQNAAQEFFDLPVENQTRETMKDCIERNIKK